MPVVLNSAQTEYPLSGTRYSTALLLLVLCALAAVGCVRRRLFINSNPLGALVYVDNEQIGTTPCAVDFTYYGTREIRLVKPGFETLKVNQPIPPPWYEYPPLDFVSDNLLPYEIRDNRSVSFNMMPEIIIPPQELIDRGNQLRQETLQGTAVPMFGNQPFWKLSPPQHHWASNRLLYLGHRPWGCHRKVTHQRLALLHRLSYPRHQVHCSQWPPPGQPSCRRQIPHHSGGLPW